MERKKRSFFIIENNPNTIEEVREFLRNGANAQILFTLTGFAGQSIKSLPFDGNATGVLERKSISCLMMEGMDLGEIKCLGVEALTGGIGADWLPGTITVESKCLKQKVKFIFNNSEHEEWVTTKGGRITKYPAL